MNTRSIVNWLLITVLVLAGTVSAQTRTADPNHLRIAEDYFRNNAAAFGLTDPSQDLKARKSYTDERGMTHIRYDQFYRGLKIFEGEAIAHVDAQSNVLVTNALRGNINLNTSPGVDPGAAAAAAVAALRLRGPYQASLPSLMILPRGDRSPIDLLVWHVQIMVSNTVDPPAQWEAFVDARNGSLLWAYNSLETSASTSTGNTMYSGKVTLNTDYQPIVAPPFSVPDWFLRDLTRSGNYTTDMNNLTGAGTGTIFQAISANTFGNGLKDNSDRSTAAADAHFGVQAAWDYYKNQHGRNGFDDKGTQMYSRVHYGVNWENAAWGKDGCSNCLTFGDGGTTFYPLVSLDIVGHEFSHGVMASEANLTYSGEPGGLNEANSDIFGTMIEYTVNSAVDKPDYWIGERAWKANWGFLGYIQNHALRYMDDPAKDGGSPACWSAGLGNLDVHYSSGPANHMFYLLAEGGTSKCNGNVVAGIGRTAAAKIWYVAVRDLMSSGTDYKGARVACLWSAAWLYGYGSPEYNAVKSAFAAINVN
jgi:Zn-dependent metalloprotease